LRNSINPRSCRFTALPRIPSWIQWGGVGAPRRYNYTWKGKTLGHRGEKKAKNGVKGEREPRRDDTPPEISGSGTGMEYLID